MCSVFRSRENGAREKSLRGGRNAMQCVHLAVEAGPEITGMLLAENLLHGSNPELSVAAVAVARGFNAAGKHAEAEALTRKLMALLPKTMAGASPTLKGAPRFFHRSTSSCALLVVKRRRERF